MALCQRCYKSPPIYDCSTCKGYFCLSCDEYIHSFPSKQSHIRRMLDIATAINTEKEESKEKEKESNIDLKNDAKIDVIKETLPIYDSNIGKNNLQFNTENLKYEKGPFIDLDDNHLIGNTNIGNKLEELTNNLQNTKINLSERLDVLDEHIHKIDEINKNELINMNSKNLKEINDLTIEKDAEIKQLQLIIEKQREKIKELKTQNKILEDDLFNSIKIKSQSIKERDDALVEKKNHENFFIKDLDEMILAQEEEKKKLVNGYEDKFIKTNSEYHDEKEKLLNELKNIQENFENLKIEHEKNIEKLNNNKIRLDMENKKRDMENQQLKQEAETLKDTLRRTKTQIEEMEKEMKDNDLINLQWAKELETMSTKTDQIKRANTILGKSCFRSHYRPES